MSANLTGITDAFSSENASQSTTNATELPAMTSATQEAKAKVSESLVIGVIICMAMLIVIAIGLLLVTRYRVAKKKARRAPDIEEVPLNKVTTLPEASTGQSDQIHPNTSARIDQSNEPDNATPTDESGQEKQTVGDVTVHPLIDRSETYQATGGVQNQDFVTPPTSQPDEIYSTVSVGSDGAKSTIRFDKQAAPDVQL